MGTLLLLDIPKVPSDSTIQELLKSVFGIVGMKNLTRLDSDHMWYIQTPDLEKLPLADDWTTTWNGLFDYK